MEINFQTTDRRAGREIITHTIHTLNKYGAKVLTLKTIVFLSFIIMLFPIVTFFLILAFMTVMKSILSILDGTKLMI